MRERIKGWWSDYWPFLAIATGAVLFIAVIVIPVTVVSHIRAADACEQKAEEMNTEARYSWQLGCRIKLDDGRWIPLENYRHVDDEGER